MKNLASCAFLLVLAAACASPTAVIDKRALRCDEPGQDIEVQAGLDDGTGGRASEQTGMRQYLVNVTNNAHGEVTVKSIRVAPNNRDGSMEGAVTKTFNETIAENDEKLFHLPLNEIWSRQMPMRPSDRPLEISVAVTLTNGDSYRCAFQLADQ